MPKEKFFSMGMDRDAQGRPRQIATLTSNPALLLNSSLFNHISHQESWPYIEGLVRGLFTEDFLTAAGLRLRSRKHADLVSFADYHGSLVTWPKHTHMIADGLRRHGFYTLAALLENCILQAVAQAGEYYEFFFADRMGRIKYHYRQENADEPSFHDFGAANLPEPGQGWTISAVINIINSRHKPAPILPVSESVRNLEREILARKYVKDLAKATGLEI
jgi:glycogen debranching enzyme